MRESVIYQEIEAQGIQKGFQQGLQQGLQQERSLVLKQLTRKIGPVPPEVQSQVESLALPQLEALGEALLEFGSLTDLTAWLAALDEEEQQSKLYNKLESLAQEFGGMKCVAFSAINALDIEGMKEIYISLKSDLEALAEHP